MIFWATRLTVSSTPTESRSRASDRRARARLWAPLISFPVAHVCGVTNFVVAPELLRLPNGVSEPIPLAPKGPDLYRLGACPPLPRSRRRSPVSSLRPPAMSGSGTELVRAVGSAASSSLEYAETWFSRLLHICTGSSMGSTMGSSSGSQRAMAKFAKKLQPLRPTIMLFGDSFTQRGFQSGQWAGRLAAHYDRTADILLRGYNGYNSAWLREVLPAVLDSPTAPALVVIQCGTNDSVKCGPVSGRIPRPHHSTA